MDTLSYKTISANKNAVQKKWVLVDAKDAVLGRLTSQVAKIMMGKHKPYYTPHVDCGDHVIMINTDKIRLTGKKWTYKKYYRHTGYPGGQKVSTPKELMNKSSKLIIEKAIRGMLPKTKLGRKLFFNLHLYLDDQHPHQAQKPKKIDIKY